MLEKESKLPSEQNSKCIIGELDGAMIPILFFEKNEKLDRRKWRKTGWKEARLSFAKEKGSLTKFFLATMGSTERAGELLGRCAKKIGWNNNTKIHCLGDGALWINEQVDNVFGSQGQYLIDFFHLSEYLAAAATKCCKKNLKKWLQKQQEKMKENKVSEVLEELKKNIETDVVNESNAPVRKCCRYIENRPGQFNYQEAINEDLPIGSGEIESGNRSVVQKRLKIPGAWWSITTAENMLALRCVRINGDWMKYWKRVSKSFEYAA